MRTDTIPSGGTQVGQLLACLPGNRRTGLPAPLPNPSAHLLCTLPAPPAPHCLRKPSPLPPTLSQAPPVCPPPAEPPEHDKGNRNAGRGGWVAVRNYELDSGAYYLNPFCGTTFLPPACTSRSGCWRSRCFLTPPTCWWMCGCGSSGTMPPPAPTASTSCRTRGWAPLWATQVGGWVGGRAGGRVGISCAWFGSVAYSQVLDADQPSMQPRQQRQASQQVYQAPLAPACQA